MSANPIRWIDLGHNHRGTPRVLIQRGTSGDGTFYHPGKKSLARIISAFELQSGRWVLSISCGSVTGRLSLMLHRNLRRVSDEKYLD